MVASTPVSSCLTRTLQCTVGNNMIALGLYIVCISHITLKRFGLVLGSGEGYRSDGKYPSTIESL
jgi:hypothetical protein